MIILLKCMHCGFECKGLTLHLKYKHSQTPAEYRTQFPGAEIFSSSVRKQMSQNSYIARIPASFEERYGKERADQIKAEIGKNSGRARLGKKRPQQGESLKLAWEKNKESWSDGIRKQAQTPEAREKQRVLMRKRIEKDGYHLSRGRETKLEKFAREAFEVSGYEVIKQKGTKKTTLGVVRFFDLWIPELNLVVECDGEHWHCNPDRISIDLSKNGAAKIEGFKLLRVSDSEFSRRLDIADRTKLLSLIFLDDKTLELRARELVENRRLKQ